MMFSTLVRLNGLYDIICGLCLLKIIDIPIMNKLHINMFDKSLMTNNMALRLLGYWIITYGMIRVFSRDDYMLVALSYYLETIILLNESKYNDKFWNLFFTAGLSSYFGHACVIFMINKNLNN